MKVRTRLLINNLFILSLSIIGGLLILGIVVSLQERGQVSRLLSNAENSFRLLADDQMQKYSDFAYHISRRFQDWKPVGPNDKFEPLANRSNLRVLEIFYANKLVHRDMYSWADSSSFTGEKTAKEIWAYLSRPDFNSQLRYSRPEVIEKRLLAVRNTALLTYPGSDARKGFVCITTPYDSDFLSSLPLTGEGLVYYVRAGTNIYFSRKEWSDENHQKDLRPLFERQPGNDALISLGHLGKYFAKEVPFFTVREKINGKPVQKPLAYFGILAYSREVGISRDTLIRTGLLLILSGTLIFSLVAFYLARRLTYPVIHLRDQVENFEKSLTPIQEKRLEDDEYRQLQGSISRMSQTIIRKTAEQKELYDIQLSMNDQLIRSGNELSEANDRLAELDRMKSEFLSSVTHELRTPMTSVLGFAKIIRNRLDGEIETAVIGNLNPAVCQSGQKALKSAKECTEIIIQEGDRLVSLINDNLDLAKIETGNIRFKAEMVMLDVVAWKAANSMASLFDQKKLPLLHAIDSDIGPVIGDQDRLEQLVINLLSNAVKFTTEGHIRLSVRRESDDAVISVEDTGPGIDAGDIPRIFDPFGASRKAEGMIIKGTGLGLSLCREIARKHGGEISVISVPGKGSEFIVRLPYYLADDSEDDTAAS